MCPPTYYAIAYEINPWMSLKRQVRHPRAIAQWRALHALLARLGARVRLMTPRRGVPDLVFTANAGLVHGRTLIRSNFRYPQRQREEPIIERYFARAGFKVVRLANTFSFEGEGDALWMGRTLVAGFRFRSDAPVHEELSRRLRAEVLPVELADRRFYHLDTCFCPLAAGEAIYYPAAFDAYGRKVIQSHVPKLLTVNEAEANRFGCNAVVVGKTVITNTGCDRLAADLRAWGYEPVAVELDEFLKAGGSAKCLTLRLDGEEAAIWE